MAFASPHITAYAVEATEFPDLARRYRVNGVPKTVVNEEVEILGALPESDFIEQAQPEYFYCGHIHEAAGQQDTIGKSRGWNVGKRGQVLDLDGLLK